MTGLVLEVKGLYAGYGSGDVLQNVELRIERGEILATIGRKRCRQEHLDESFDRADSAAFRLDRIFGPRYRPATSPVAGAPGHRITCPRAGRSFRN